MKKLTLLITSIFALSFPALTMADDRPNHFKGKPAETLERAVVNFSEYNGKLAEILAKDALGPQELQQIHELTYTLEIALEKINTELTELAKTLEVVHVASESADAKMVKTKGLRYLDTARQIIK